MNPSRLLVLAKRPKRSARPGSVTLLAGIVGFFALTALPASAEPVPSGQELYVSSVVASQNPNNNTVFAFGVLPTDSSGAYAADDTQLKLDVYSCGNFLQSSVSTVSDYNGKGVDVFFTDAVINRVGPSLQYNLTITQAGYDPYVRSGSYSGYTVSRPTCDTINGVLPPTPPPGCAITKLSAKATGATAYVTRTVKITPATSANCTIRYKWTVNGTQVGTTTSLYVKKTFKGKTLVAKVIASRSGYTQKTQSISYGTVR